MTAHPLSAAELLDAASVCRTHPGPEAGVYLAALDRTDLSFEQCAHLPIGARDAMLVAMRAAMFGERLDLAAKCPHCEARLDVGLTTDALLGIAPASGAPREVAIGERRFEVRAADSADLAAVAELIDIEMARETIAIRCLVPLDGGERPDFLADEEVDAIGAALAAIDPAGDPYVALECGACGAAWDAPIDIAAILAGEIEWAADTLLDEIHELARAYHWSEAAILALSQDRRRAYLARLEA